MTLPAHYPNKAPVSSNQIVFDEFARLLNDINVMFTAVKDSPLLRVFQGLTDGYTDLRSLNSNTGDLDERLGFYHQEYVGEYIKRSRRFQPKTHTNVLTGDFVNAYMNSSSSNATLARLFADHLKKNTCVFICNGPLTGGGDFLTRNCESDTQSEGVSGQLTRETRYLFGGVKEKNLRFSELCCGDNNVSKDELFESLIETFRKLREQIIEELFVSMFGHVTVSNNGVSSTKTFIDEADAVLTDIATSNGGTYTPNTGLLDISAAGAVDYKAIIEAVNDYRLNNRNIGSTEELHLFVDPVTYNQLLGKYRVTNPACCGENLSKENFTHDMFYVPEASLIIARLPLKFWNNNATLSKVGSKLIFPLVAMGDFRLAFFRPQVQDLTSMFPSSQHGIDISDSILGSIPDDFHVFASSLPWVMRLNSLVPCLNMNTKLYLAFGVLSGRITGIKSSYILGNPGSGTPPTSSAPWHDQPIASPTGSNGENIVVNTGLSDSDLEAIEQRIEAKLLAKMAATKATTTTDKKGK